MNRAVPMIDPTGEAERASYKRARDTTPVLIDLSSDDDNDNDDNNDGAGSASIHANATRNHGIVRDTGHRGASLGADDRAAVRAPARYGYDPAESDDRASDDDERDDDDRSDVDDSQDSDDSDDDGSDLKDFIVSDDDEEDDDSDDDGDDARTRGVDSEGDFVPSDDGDIDDDDDDDVEDNSDTPTDCEGDGDAVDATDDQSSSQAASQDSTSDADSTRDRTGKSKAPRAGAKTTKKKANNARNSVADVGKRPIIDNTGGDDDGDDVVIVGAASAAEPRPAKRARVDEAEAPAIDPTNIVSGKRSRRVTERYMDRHFMEFMVRDVPANQIAAVFDDEDEYFQSGISLTDSSEEEDDGDDDDGGSNKGMDCEDDLDSSDYEALDALSSSSRPRSRQRPENRWASEAAAPAHNGASAADIAIDLSRPPSTVAALLRSLAAQPGGIRPSVASPRSAPTARTPLLP
ncbi:hypothetical protein pmac_cds_232 [Pandoravirus macleodensis]|uniref:Uncharacterized protein n=1 Tax=Pandoravirus macleodensis TaxID=2107707 RepID=A0A2U7UF52_9VIRU|nr:hypothetical protein pmac_cds_232 [Pandoravirus macleodensis]AVK76920.1 hypothetical protein pmac_cds_232 [Pandoravirus macleodensis]